MNFLLFDDAPCRAARANLLANGGFEIAGGGGGDVFASWTEVLGGPPPGAIADELVIVQAGAHAAKLTASLFTDTTLTSDAIAVTPGTGYTLTFWTRGLGVGPGRYAVWDATNAAWILAATSTAVPGVVYTQVTYAFTAPAGCLALQVVFLCPAAPGLVAYFDTAALS
jgi:hypothetical protein